MKGGSLKIKNISQNKCGVFGLTAVQTFFGSILAIALLAFVIVIIMGTLQSADLVQSSTGTATETNKYINITGYTLGQSGLDGFTGTITEIVNATDGVVIASGNYTLTDSVLYNATATNWADVNVTYSYTYDSDAQNQLQSITGNTSTGVTGFFNSISPVYAILAVLVIILVLVVLVRVVQAPTARGSTPQL